MFQKRHPDIKGRPNSTRFFKYCRKNGHYISRCSKKKQVQDEVNKIRKNSQLKMKKKFHLKILTKKEDQLIYLIKMPLTKTTEVWINQKQQTIQIVAKIITAFVIIITRKETISKRLMHIHLLRPIDLKPMMIYILEKTNSENLNKLLDSSTTKEIGHPVVILRVDNKTPEVGYNSKNSRDSTRSHSPNFRANQIRSETTNWIDEEVNYCDSITDFFPLN